MIFQVPQALSDGTQRVSLTSTASFEEALELFHSTIGCCDVARKPDLSYKLSSATVKADAINLRTSEDWVGCIEDVVAAIKKKKGTGPVLSIRIHVVEQVSPYAYA